MRVHARTHNRIEKFTKRGGTKIRSVGQVFIRNSGDAKNKNNSGNKKKNSKKKKKTYYQLKSGLKDTPLASLRKTRQKNSGETSQGVTAPNQGKQTLWGRFTRHWQTIRFASGKKGKRSCKHSVGVKGRRISGFRPGGGGRDADGNILGHTPFRGKSKKTRGTPAGVTYLTKVGPRIKGTGPFERATEKVRGGKQQTHARLKTKTGSREEGGERTNPRLGAPLRNRR